jgi:DNA-binding PadR family transcriptional regulator
MDCSEADSNLTEICAYGSNKAKNRISSNRHSILSTKVEFVKIMRRNYLGEFEELILLTVAVLHDCAYGAAITDELEHQTGRSVSLSAVHAALQRLEEKGMLRSVLGEATMERGGRRKRLFSVTAQGSQALQNVREMRNKLWDSISPQGRLTLGI